MYVSNAKQVLVSAGKLPALAFPANQVNQCSSTTHQPLRKKLYFVRNTMLCIRIPTFECYLLPGLGIIYSKYTTSNVTQNIPHRMLKIRQYNQKCKSVEFRADSIIPAF
jgi:hypothetical protein